MKVPMTWRCSWVTETGHLAPRYTTPRAMGLSPSRWVTSIRTAERRCHGQRRFRHCLRAVRPRGRDVRRSLELRSGRSSAFCCGDSVNGNGSQDILIANERSSDVTLLSGHGDGTFAAGESYSTSIAAGSIAIGHFDQDGWPDVVTGARDWGISVLINQHDTRMIEVDIKPGSSPNSINPFSRGVIPVALLGSVTFDVADVDESTLAFGPGGAPIAHQYAPPRGRQLRWHHGPCCTFSNTGNRDCLRDESATLAGKLLDGQAIEGSDSIQTVGCDATGRPPMRMRAKEQLGNTGKNGPVNIDRQ